MVGEEGDGEEHEQAHEPARSLEAVREAQHAGADDGDEDVSEGLEIGGQSWCLSQEGCVLSRVGWKGVGRGSFFLGEHHCFFLSVTPHFSILNSVLSQITCGSLPCQKFGILQQRVLNLMLKL